MKSQAVLDSRLLLPCRLTPQPLPCVPKGPGGADPQASCPWAALVGAGREGEGFHPCISLWKSLELPSFLLAEKWSVSPVKDLLPPLIVVSGPLNLVPIAPQPCHCYVFTAHGEADRCTQRRGPAQGGASELPPPPWLSVVGICPRAAGAHYESTRFPTLPANALHTLHPS